MLVVPFYEFEKLASDSERAAYMRERCMEIIELLPAQVGGLLPAFETN